MKALDLSKVKVVGFIPNFNPKCGYPEFAYNGSSANAAPKYDFNNPLLKERIAKPQAKHIKNAKKAFKKRNPNFTFSTKGILDYQLEVSSGIVWRTN